MLHLNVLQDSEYYWLPDIGKILEVSFAEIWDQIPYLQDFCHFWTQ